MKFRGDSFELIFFARGGEGGKTAAEILAQAAAREGKYVKAFPFFGPERSGAPTKVYLRISKKEIRTQEPVQDPDIVVVLDDTLLASHYEDMVRNLDREESLIVNTKKTKEEVQEYIPDFKGSIHVIDASTIARNITGRAIANVVIFGYLIKITEIVKLENVKNVFREIFTEKLGQELTNKNILAIQKAYDEI